MSGTRHQKPAYDTRSEQRAFVLWAIRTLKLDISTEDGGIYALRAGPDQEPLFDGREVVRFAFAAPETGEADTLEPMAPGTPLFNWLMQRLHRRSDPVAQAVPAHQPQHVHEVSPLLFGAYRLAKGGSMHLSGCTLEDRPLLRLTYAVSGTDQVAQLIHTYYYRDGKQVEAQLVTGLQLDEVAVPQSPLPRLSPGEWTRWLQASQRAAESDRCQRSQFVLATAIWCKYVEGKLTAVFGSESVQIPFAGWAQLLVNEQITAPPYHCPLSDKRSYHLAATDDGCITVEEAIAVCEVTGKRVLQSQLSQCHLTGKRVVPEQLSVCPVTEDQILSSSLERCGMCRQPVSPQALQGGRCAACRSVRTVSKDDPRMARVLGEYPKLDRWPRWQLSETATAYVFVAATLLKRLLLVVTKESLEILHMASGTRLSRSWSDVPAEQRDEQLQ